jgi:hypothetical protein
MISSSVTLPWKSNLHNKQNPSVSLRPLRAPFLHIKIDIFPPWHLLLRFWPKNLKGIAACAVYMNGPATTGNFCPTLLGPLLLAHLQAYETVSKNCGSRREKAAPIAHYLSYGTTENAWSLK